MDPSVLLRAYKPVQWPDPVEEYKGFLSLRQMMDLGKLRQVQLQQTELENQQKQRDMAEYEMYRRGVSLLPSNATLEQTIQALGPKYGAAHFKLTHEAQTALNQQRAAESAQAKAALELGQKRGQSLADMMYANRLLPEGERQAAWDDAWGLPVDLPPTEAQTQAQIAQGYGSKEQQAMANAAAEAAQKAKTRPFELRKSEAEAKTAEGNVTKQGLETSKQQLDLADRYLGLVIAQPSQNAWDKFYGSLPDEGRGQLSPMFSPLELAKARAMMQTTQQRQQAEAAEQARAETERHHRAMESGNVDIAATDLSPDALNMMADNFATTGVMPPLGMGKSATELRRKIINKAAERNPDLAGNRAAFTSNLQSLNNLQKQRDAIGAFEQTAMKNIDLFLKTVKPIIDTGSPWLNQPFRTATRTATGDPNFLKFQAARRVAVNEIAKITSNPNLSGALSDSARHEVESFIPENATAKEIVAVLNVLKQDIGNRVQSMDEQIGAIKQRISPRASRDQIPNPIVDSGKTTTVRMRAPNGQVKDIPADQVQYYESRGAKRVQ